jgi:hypothetical protein
MDSTDHLGAAPLLCPGHSRAKRNRAAQRCVILGIEYVPLRSGEDSTVPEDIAGSALMVSGCGRATPCHVVRDVAQTFGGK